MVKIKKAIMGLAWPVIVPNDYASQVLFGGIFFLKKKALGPNKPMGHAWHGPPPVGLEPYRARGLV